MTVITFAHGLALGLFYGAGAILAVLLITALIFMAQEYRAHNACRERGQDAVPPCPVSPPPTVPPAREAGGTDLLHAVQVIESDVPRGVTLTEWRRARRAAERGAA